MQFYFPTSLNLGQENSEGFHQELLRGLTHKLNNLLAVIQGFSSLILMTEDLDPSVTELLDFRFEHFELRNYDPHPHIKADVSV